jgi:hypothetical protein
MEEASNEQAAGTTYPCVAGGAIGAGATMVAG